MTLLKNRIRDSIFKMFKIGKRKIDQVNYTKKVSLPAFWVKQLKLKKGDDLEVLINPDDPNQIIFQVMK